MIEDNQSFSQRLRASPEAVTCEFGEGVALLHLKKNIYYSLNAVGAEVWQFIQEPTSRDAILKYISRKFLVKKEVCGPDIDRLLAELENNDLLVKS